MWIKENFSSNLNVLMDWSPLNHCGFLISDFASVMFSVSILSVASWHVHSSNIIGMTETRWKSSSDRVEVMRHPSPLCDLNTKCFFNEGWGDSVSHSDSLLLSIFAAGSLVPIPRVDVVIEFVYKVNTGNIADPHTERTITVNGVFLEIPVHFICVLSLINWYCKIQIHDWSRL